MGILQKALIKLNPAQPAISSRGNTQESSTENILSVHEAYKKVGIVGRSINMLVDDVAAIDYKVGENLFPAKPGVIIKSNTLKQILNYRPNPFQDINQFRRALLMDFIIDGNIFIYYDNSEKSFYHVPARNMTVHADEKTYISRYSYDSGTIEYTTSEIIHIRDNSYRNIYRGSSRLSPILDEIDTYYKMKQFQKSFFKNGTIGGLVVESENMLSSKIKERMLAEWQAQYNPTSGGRRPMILDGGLKLKSLNESKFKDLDFSTSVTEKEDHILKTLGIPPVLLNSGNNANIRPNHRLYYLETIIPIINKITSALTAFFGFEIYEDISYIEGLRPELRDQATYLSTLVNNGIVTGDEARVELGREPKGGSMAEIRVPQNIAGSASNPSSGGAPKKDTNEKQ